MDTKRISDRRSRKCADHRVIALLTDFGLREAYAGILKGVILGIAPSVKVIDLTHEIPAQDIRAASFSLAMAYPYFPPGTIHVAVVDPGVGTHRRAVAVSLEEGVLVGPDNGVFSGVLEHGAAKEAVLLTRSEFWLSEHPGGTFHGRDIFAPVAAHLASGVLLSRLGVPLDPATLVRLSPSPWAVIPGGFSGFVQHVDSFGNLVTNIPGRLVEGRDWKIRVADQEIPGGKAYGDVVPGAPVALVGSHGFLEIAVNSGNAQVELSLYRDDPIGVVLVDAEHNKESVE